MSQVVWWSDRRVQKYPECRAENHPKYPELVWMEKHLKCPKRLKHLDRVWMRNRLERGFP
jgi:hypothetical protein